MTLCLLVLFALFFVVFFFCLLPQEGAGPSTDESNNHYEQPNLRPKASENERSAPIYSVQPFWIQLGPSPEIGRSLQRQIERLGHRHSGAPKIGRRFQRPGTLKRIVQPKFYSSIKLPPGKIGRSFPRQIEKAGHRLSGGREIGRRFLRPGTLKRIVQPKFYSSIKLPPGQNRAEFSAPN